MKKETKAKIRITYVEQMGKIVRIDVSIWKLSGGVRHLYRNVARRDIPNVPLSLTQKVEFRSGSCEYRSQPIEVNLTDYRWMDIAINGILA